MKFLIPEDELGVFADQGGVPRVDSLFVADVFDKQHFHVLQGTLHPAFQRDGTMCPVAPVFPAGIPDADGHDLPPA